MSGDQSLVIDLGDAPVICFVVLWQSVLLTLSLSNLLSTGMDTFPVVSSELE